MAEIFLEEYIDFKGYISAIVVLKDIGYTKEEIYYLGYFKVDDIEEAFKVEQDYDLD